MILYTLLCMISIFVIIISICLFLYWIGIVLNGWYYNFKTLKKWITIGFLLLIGGILGICYSLAKGGFF